MPSNFVLPSPKAAATARIGYSSIIDGARPGGTVMPLSRPPFTRTSPTSSPPIERRFSTLMSAPISISVSTSPKRVGFISTFSTVTSEPSTISAATIGKAAELGSPGTTIFCGLRLARPSSRMIRAPSSPVPVSIAAPKAASIRSVWSRVGTGSMMVVVPGTLRPASSTADLTCAEATGSRYSIGSGDVGTAERRRQPLAGTGQDLDPHPPEWVEHPPHRPADEGCVAGEGGGEGVAAGDAHREPHASAGIAVVDHVFGFQQPADAEALDAPDAAVGAGDGRAEGAHRLGGGEHVLALEQALDRGLADGERAEHEGAVRDRLVARRPDMAVEGSRASGAERGCAVFCRHGWMELRIASRPSGRGER